MAKEFYHLNQEEQLIAENEYMKMKLMLENGPDVIGWNFSGLTPRSENEFLKKIIEYEKLFDKTKTIRIADKLMRPAHFRPVTEIPDNEIDKAWEELLIYMRRHLVNLEVCSPNISNRELYRFTLEELFNCVISDVEVQGLMCTFMYDDFHPDLEFENTITATDHCINYILDKKPMEWMYDFKEENLRLNEYRSLTIQQLKTIVNKFKDAYDDLTIIEIKSTGYSIQNNECKVSGSYWLRATIGHESYQLAGNWEVLLSPGTRDHYWTVSEIDIEGIRF